MRARWQGFRSVLAPEIERFLAFKRALGRQFDNEEKTLRLFDNFLAQEGLEQFEQLVPELLDRFLVSRCRQRPRSYNHLLGVVRRLLDWLVVQGVMSQTPLTATPRRETSRRQPYLFDIVQARRLLDSARQLADNNKAPLRGLTYHAVFALLFGLGLRVGELCRLCCGDVDWDRRLLIVRRAKFGKSRLVPFGPQVANLLTDYIQTRHGARPPASNPLFTFGRGRPINPCTVSQVFHHLMPQLGLQVPPGTSPPCLHHLRHSFAVGTLLRWYREGINPAGRLLQLSTFMGHVSPSSTSVYLTITDELLRLASDRFERFCDRANSENPS